MAAGGLYCYYLVADEGVDKRILVSKGQSLETERVFDYSMWILKSLINYTVIEGASKSLKYKSFIHRGGHPF